MKRKLLKQMVAIASAMALVAGALPASSLIVSAEENPMSVQVLPKAAEGRETLNFNSDWGFYRGDLEGAEAVDFDDSEFASVTVPHTMRLEKKHNNTTKGVYKGIGWYRRYFTLDESYAGKKLQLQFEGVMTDSDIYLNGEKIYTRNGGYIGFTIDITDKVKFGEENVLAVRVSNADNPNTPPGKPDGRLDFHYYGGIYRDVMLEVSEKTHVTDVLAANETAGGGTFLTYPEVTKENATVHVKSHVQNDNEEAKTVYTKQILKDAQGNVVTEDEAEAVEIAAGEAAYFEHDLAVANPNLWGVDSPYLYDVVTEVYENDVKVDEVTNRAGIRTIEYKPDGFYLNGERIYLRGGNRHQSFQNVGDAAPNSMQKRDAILIKQNGFNAVRATHYPNDPAFLDACDEVGLLVIECQPGWQQWTNTTEFYNNTLRDTHEMIRRDRNRPSVVLWETSLNETYGTPEGWAKEAVEIAHNEYPGDQIYTASDWGLHGKYYDVCYKVQDTQWSMDQDKWVDYNPEMPFFTREWGDYEGSSKALRKDGEAAQNTQIETRQRYLNGNGYSDWGGLDASDRIGGYFLWSWNDYSRGSTTNTLGSGTVDMDRYEKYCYYWLQSMQPKDNPVYGPMIFISSEYTANSSLTIPVFSNCDSVKLYQNGELVQEITREEAGKAVPNIMKKGGSPIFKFNLSEFKAGTLKAEGIVDGEVAAEYEVKTPEEAVRFELEVKDRGIGHVADGSDLIPVHIKAVDENGTIVPDYSGLVHVEVAGEGALVGENIPRVKVEDQVLENGIGYAFVRATDVAGNITVTASADDMEDGVKTVTTKECSDKFVPEVEGREFTNTEENFEVEDVVYENIAIGKEVTASSEQSGNYMKNLVDDDEGTRWCASGPSLPQWVMVDLGKPSAIAGFQILWENASSVYKYSIEVSNDKVNWTTALDMLSNDKINTDTETQLAKTAGRYVRLNVTGISDGWASIFEFRVIPDKGDIVVEPGERIKDEAIAKITASEGSAEGRGTELVRDGETNIGTGWLSPNSEKFPQTLEMQFKEPMTLVGSAVYWEKDSTVTTYDIEVTKDGKTWIPVMQGLEETWHDEEPETFAEPQEDVIGLRLVIKGILPTTGNVGVAEWLVYGTKYEKPAPKEFEYASDLNWESAHSDYGSVTKDANPYHDVMTLNTPEGAKIFAKGVGADTNSYVIYNIEGKNFNKFESYIGIDARAGKQGGEAIFKVYMDDEVVYTSPVKMRNDNCDFISLPIAEGVKTVKLEAVWSGNAENPEARYNTHVNWADAKFLIQQEEEVVESDKTDLEALITYAQGQKDNAKYDILVPAVKKAFEAALDKAEAVVENPKATQEQVNAAYDRLLQMVQMLDFTGDNTVLKGLVAHAQELKEGLYTAETWKVFVDARTKAQGVLDDENALQAEIDAAAKALDAAMNSLKVIPVDKTKLQKLVKKAAEYDLTKYTKTTGDILTGAREEAEKVLEKNELTQAEIDKAYADLQKAIFGLRLIPDKGQLEGLIKNAEAVNTANYTVKSAVAFAAALDYAKEVFADGDATEEEVKAAEKALEEAQKNLVAKADADKEADNNAAGKNDDKADHKVASDNGNNKVASDDESKKETSKTAAKTGDAGAALPVAVAGIAALAALVALKKRR